MGGGASKSDVRQQMGIEQGLFRQYAATGVPIMSGTQDYIRGALAQGTPAYVSNAYNTARASAGFEADRAQGGLMSQLGGRSDGALLEGLTQAGAAGGRSFIEERAGISASQAANRIEQRNNLLRLLSGQAAENTNLAAGFGRLGLQGIGQAALQGGDPFFEATLGLGSAGAAGYLNWLSRPQNYSVAGTQPAASYMLGNVPGGSAAGYPKG